MPTLPSSADLKAYVRTTLAGASEDPIFDNSVDAAFELVSSTIGRELVAAGASTSRVFAPEGWSDILFIDDCDTITSIVEKGTVVATTAWQAELLNHRGPGGEYRPYHRVRRLNGIPWYFNRGEATITVNAAWGFGTLPASLIEALKVLVKDMILYRDVRFGVFQVADWGNVRTRQAELITRLERAWRRTDRTVGLA